MISIESNKIINNWLQSQEYRYFETFLEDLTKTWFLELSDPKLIFNQLFTLSKILQDQRFYLNQDMLSIVYLNMFEIIDHFNKTKFIDLNQDKENFGDTKNKFTTASSKEIVNNYDDICDNLIDVIIILTSLYSTPIEIVKEISNHSISNLTQLSFIIENICWDGFESTKALLFAFKINDILSCLLDNSRILFKSTTYKERTNHDELCWYIKILNYISIYSTDFIFEDTDETQIFIEIMTNHIELLK